jgi:hypothetical protein
MIGTVKPQPVALNTPLMSRPPIERVRTKIAPEVAAPALAPFRAKSNVLRPMPAPQIGQRVDVRA